MQSEIRLHSSAVFKGKCCESSFDVCFRRTMSEHVSNVNLPRYLLDVDFENIPDTWLTLYRITIGEKPAWSKADYKTNYGQTMAFMTALVLQFCGVQVPLL